MKLYYTNDPNDGWIDCWKIRVTDKHYICTDYDDDDLVIDITGMEIIADDYAEIYRKDL